MGRDVFIPMSDPEAVVRQAAEHSGLSEETCRDLIRPMFWLAGGWDALKRIEIRDREG